LQGARSGEVLAPGPAAQRQRQDHEERAEEAVRGRDGFGLSAMRTRADLLLVARGLAESRAKARAAIEAGGVTADGRPVAKASELLADDAVVVATPAHPWVGRGALKLEHALAVWPIRVEGRVVLDVGAST